jgi:hypothetical protein
MKQAMLTLLLVSIGGGAANAADPATLLTQGRLAADMGDRAAAAAAFEALADDSSAPATVRWEALVRLGLVRRDAGDAKGSVEAFQRAWKDYRQDKDAMALLVQAVGGALPSSDRWDAVWQKVVVKADAARPDHPAMRVEWPGVPAGLRRYSGQGVTFAFEDGSLYEVFRAFADVTRLNVVVHPGVQGRVTVTLKDVPWDDALDRILGPNGLAANLTGPVLEIATPEELPPPRAFKGAPTDLDFQDVALEDALRQVAERGGRAFAASPGLAGTVTIRLSRVPWDQAFDLVARSNGLTWKDDGKTIRVALRADMR